MLETFLSTAEGWSTAAMVIRMVSALVIGTVIGIDRALKRRGAGIKTHALVCLGAALVMMTGQYIKMNFEGNMDIARMGAQVISGVGFLGVGTIIVTGKNQIRGLTTAAGLWACACLGLAVGIGFVKGAFITLVLVMLTLKVLTKIDARLHMYARVFDIYIEFPNNQCVSEFMEKIHSMEIKIYNIELSKSKIKGEGPNAILCIEVKDRTKRAELIEDLHKMECVKFIEIL
ncbi:MAG: MgtC/SapB family protein [Hungatella sp.]|nr:MgtC/SapB family protein [Hungatella sp.]